MISWTTHFRAKYGLIFTQYEIDEAIPEKLEAKQAAEEKKRKQAEAKKNAAKAKRKAKKEGKAQETSSVSKPTTITPSENSHVGNGPGATTENQDSQGSDRSSAPSDTLPEDSKLLLGMNLDGTPSSSNRPTDGGKSVTKGPLQVLLLHPSFHLNSPSKSIFLS